MTYTLQECLNKLAICAQDSKIYAKETLDQLNALPKSQSLIKDGELIQKQLSLLQRCVDITDTFFMDVAEINLHTVRYYHKELITCVNSHIRQADVDNDDPYGQLNYVQSFIDICEENLIYIDNLAHCDKIAARAINADNPNPPPDLGPKQLGWQQMQQKLPQTPQQLMLLTQPQSYPKPKDVVLANKQAIII